MLEIPLTQNQVAMIDDDDLDLVSQYKWYAKFDKHTKSFYAATMIRNQNGKQETRLMHRLIMDAKKDDQVDHVHHNTLDNRKSELRLCTKSQNQHNRGKQSNNTSGFKGVHWHKTKRKWMSQIYMRGKKKHLGYYKTPEEAYLAYCKYAEFLHGEFACVE